MSIKENITQIIRELPSDVKLVAVSKFHPVESIMEAYGAGQRVFAESRPQELAAKVPAMESWLAANGMQNDIVWHFIGHLQTNKLKMVLPYASIVQSVDSLHLLEAIEKWGRDNGKVVAVLLEYHIASEESKQGFSEEEIKGILSDAGRFPHIRFRGLMGMATFTEDESVIRSDFSRISLLFKELSSSMPDFSELSIGMSGDYRIAIEYGSTMVRIGTMIFGERNY
ncbi:MAG: YggS family pyridoxal phosphate-dependent enzyme [Bacteroidales bacterium]|nr:YggS family pyridoxal phosphate-dependent enzyme [Bacteroidales bacterium]